MRIDGYSILNAIQAVRPKAVQATTAATGVHADYADLSTRAADMQTVMDALKSVPEVRQERIDALAKQIAAGTYVVDERAIAAKLLKK